MKIFLWLILSLWLGLTTNAKSSNKPPHIIFCLIDDWGWNDVSFHGSLQIPTPNIDTLAANAVILNNYYTQPLCTPSRASLMTGTHPISYGLQYHVLELPQPAGLSLNYTIIPQHMKSLGYRTYALGKWHLGFYRKEYTPSYRGFDSYLGYWTGKMDYYTHIDWEKYDDLGKLWGRVLRRDMEYADEYNGTYATSLFTKEANTMIRKHDKSKPLFMFLAHLAVHTGNDDALFQAPQEYIDQFDYIEDKNRRTFAAMTAAMDDAIGDLFNTLDKEDMLDNTILVISTDNGGEGAGFRGGVGSNWPLRGNKGTTWEGGVRGNGLIWSPLIKKMPRISNQLMSIHDWLPTLYRAGGGDPDELGNIYGVNLWDALVDDTPSPRTELLHNIDPVYNVETVRKGDYKLVIENYVDNQYSGWYGPSGRDNGISKEEYKERLDDCIVKKILEKRGGFTKVTKEMLSKLDITPLCPHSEKDSKGCDSRKNPCLFNIAKDPCEEKNIADKHPKVVEELIDLLDDYHKKAADLVKKEIDPKADPARFDHHWTNWDDFP